MLNTKFLTIKFLRLYKQPVGQEHHFIENMEPIEEKKYILGYISILEV